jgi:hypothetical protein
LTPIVTGSDFGGQVTLAIPAGEFEKKLIQALGIDKPVSPGIRDGIGSRRGYLVRLLGDAAEDGSEFAVCVSAPVSASIDEPSPLQVCVPILDQTQFAWTPQDFTLYVDDDDLHGLLGIRNVAFSITEVLGLIEGDEFELEGYIFDSEVLAEVDRKLRLHFNL